jgi:organic radical activating enzyme
MWDKANTRWDRFQKSYNDGAIAPIYDTDHHYVNTKDIILKTVAENYTISDDGTGTKQAAQSDVLRYVNTEIEEQEIRWEAEGLDVTPKMRKDFILEVQDYVNKTWTGNDEDKFKAPETLTMEDERARIIEEERLEAEEIAKQEKQEETNNTVVFQRGGEPVTLKQFSNEIVENLNNIDAPKLIETVIGGIIDEDRKFELQTQPKIKKYINEVLGAEFDADILSALSDDDFDLISETITKKLNLPFSDNNTENLDMIQDLIFSLYNLEG